MHAMAFKIEEIENEEELSSIEAMTVECPNCDPDSPVASPRQSCPVCKGTGFAPMIFADIVREIREAKKEALIGSREKIDDDLFLEY